MQKSKRPFRYDGEKGKSSYRVLYFVRSIASNDSMASSSDSTE